MLRRSRVSAQDVVQCVINCLLSCPGCVWFCVRGAALGTARKGSTPPTPEGQQPASRHTRHLLPDLQGARAEEIPDCSSYSLRIPWIATAVGCQSTHASPGFLSLRPGDSTSSLVVKGTSLAPNFGWTKGRS